MHWVAVFNFDIDQSVILTIIMLQKLTELRGGKRDLPTFSHPLFYN